MMVNHFPPKMHFAHENWRLLKDLKRILGIWRSLKPFIKTGIEKIIFACECTLRIADKPLGIELEMSSKAIYYDADVGSLSSVCIFRDLSKLIQDFLSMR